jgi:hypothetical protein
VELSRRQFTKEFKLAAVRRPGNAGANLLDDGIDRHLWIIRLREKMPLFGTLRWETQSLMLKGVRLRRSGNIHVRPNSLLALLRHT